MSDNQELTLKELNEHKGDDLKIDMIKLLKKEIFSRDDCLLVAQYWMNREELYSRTRFEDRKYAETRLSSVIQCARVDGYKDAMKQLTTTQQALDTAVEALEAIAEHCYLNLNPTYTDIDNIKSICSGLNIRIDIAKAALTSIKE